MPEDPRATARRLAARAVDRASSEHEKVVCARKVCELIMRHDLLGLEEHQKPSVEIVTRRVPGPLYLFREDEAHFYFVKWQDSFAFRGIRHNEEKALKILKAACWASWLTDEEKKRELGTVPGNPVAAYLDVTTTRS